MREDCPTIAARIIPTIFSNFFILLPPVNF
jgi:hypothetical protein